MDPGTIKDEAVGIPTIHSLVDLANKAEVSLTYRDADNLERLTVKKSRNRCA